jgi:hypothetical protein
MHAFASHREPALPLTTSLRALLAEPGGRRRLVEALEDRLGPALCLDDQQLLLRAGALLEDRRLGDLAL